MIEKVDKIIREKTVPATDVVYDFRVGFLDPDHNLTREEITQVAAMGDRSLRSYNLLVKDVIKNRGSGKTEKFLNEWALAAGSKNRIPHTSLMEQINAGPDPEFGDSPIAVEGMSVYCALLRVLRENHWSFEASSSRGAIYPKGYQRIPPELSKVKDKLEKRNREVEDIYHYLLKRGLEEFVKTEETEWEALNKALDAARQVTNLSWLQRFTAHPNNALALRESLLRFNASELPEERNFAKKLTRLMKDSMPTLVRYTTPSEYDRSLAKKRLKLSGILQSRKTEGSYLRKTRLTELAVSPNADNEFLAGFLSHKTGINYPEAHEKINRLSSDDREKMIDEIMEGISLHDKPPEELNRVRVRAVFDMTVGGIIDALRHRTSQEIFPQLDPYGGFAVPKVFLDLKIAEDYRKGLELNKENYETVSDLGERYRRIFGPYFVSRGNILPGFSIDIDGANFFHLIKLRASQGTHQDLNGPMQEAAEESGKQSRVFQHLVMKE